MRAEFPHTSTLALSFKLDRTSNAISQQARRMGLHKATEYLFQSYVTRRTEFENTRRQRL